MTRFLWSVAQLFPIMGILHFYLHLYLVNAIGRLMTSVTFTLFKVESSKDSYVRFIDAQTVSKINSHLLCLLHFWWFME